jgi:hypothetical protein
MPNEFAPDPTAQPLSAPMYDENVTLTENAVSTGPLSGYPPGAVAYVRQFESDYNLPLGAQAEQDLAAEFVNAVEEGRPTEYPPSVNAALSSLRAANEAAALPTQSVSASTQEQAVADRFRFLSTQAIVSPEDQSLLDSVEANRIWSNPYSRFAFTWNALIGITGAPSIPGVEYETSEVPGEVETIVEQTGGTYYVTNSGHVIETPPGYSGVTAQNGKGLVLLPAGQTLNNNSDIIRYGEPNAQSPQEYFRYYNGLGQPLVPTTGQPGPNSATHPPINYVGPLKGYPGK